MRGSGGGGGGIHEVSDLGRHKFIYIDKRRANTTTTTTTTNICIFPSNTLSYKFKSSPVFIIASICSLPPLLIKSHLGATVGRNVWASHSKEAKFN